MCRGYYLEVHLEVNHTQSMRLLVVTPKTG